jgi:RNA polymerase sigma-70 factor (ECF subfamily)
MATKDFPFGTCESDDFSPDTSPSPTLPQEANDEVIRYYSSMVYRIALTKTKSTHDAEDVFQEVFLKLVMNKKPFESEEHRKAWLIRVTINCCNSHFVAPWNKNVSSLDDALLSVLADEEAEDGFDEGQSDVYAEILRLPENMREVILLYYYEEMSIREIAFSLNTTEANVKKRLSRARQRLRLELESSEL